MADKIEKLQFLINKNIKDNNWTIIHKYADKMLALATEIQNEEKIYEAEYIIATSLHNMNLLEEAKKMWDQCEKKYCVDYFYETVNDICEYIDLETIIQDYQVINLFEEIQENYMCKNKLIDIKTISIYVNHTATLLRLNKFKEAYVRLLLVFYHHYKNNVNRNDIAFHELFGYMLLIIDNESELGEVLLKHVISLKLEKDINFNLTILNLKNVQAQKSVTTENYMKFIILPGLTLEYINKVI